MSWNDNQDNSVRKRQLGMISAHIKQLVKKMHNTILRCEFSVEGAYVMAIVIFSLAVVMQHAYKMRDDAVANYVTNEACVDGAYTEDMWLGTDGVTEVGSRASELLHAVGRLKGQNITVSREGSIFEKLTGITAKAYCSKDEKEITVKVRDPENYMRASSLLEGFK